MVGQNKGNLFNLLETENNLLVRAGKVAPFICHCASLIHATRKFFFIHYLLEISLVLTSD